MLHVAVNKDGVAPEKVAKVVVAKAEKVEKVGVGNGVAARRVAKVSVDEEAVVTGR